MYVYKTNQEDFKKNKANPTEFWTVHFQRMNSTANTA